MQAILQNVYLSATPRESSTVYHLASYSDKSCTSHSTYKLKIGKYFSFRMQVAAVKHEHSVPWFNDANANPLMVTPKQWRPGVIKHPCCSILCSSSPWFLVQLIQSPEMPIILLLCFQNSSAGQRSILCAIKDKRSVGQKGIEHLIFPVCWLSQEEKQISYHPLNLNEEMEGPVYGDKWISTKVAYELGVTLLVTKPLEDLDEAVRSTSHTQFRKFRHGHVSGYQVYAINQFLLETACRFAPWFKGWCIFYKSKSAVSIKGALGWLKSWVIDRVCIKMLHHHCEAMSILNILLENKAVLPWR